MHKEQTVYIKANEVNEIVLLPTYPFSLITSQNYLSSPKCTKMMCHWFK